MYVRVFLGNNLLSWNLKKQMTIFQYSVKSGYRSITHYDELRWCTFVCHDLHVRLSYAPKILCDNSLAIFLASNPVSRQRY